MCAALDLEQGCSNYLVSIGQVWTAELLAGWRALLQQRFVDMALEARA